MYFGNILLIIALIGSFGAIRSNKSISNNLPNNTSFITSRIFSWFNRAPLGTTIFIDQIFILCLLGFLELILNSLSVNLNIQL